MSLRGTRIGWEDEKDSWEEMSMSKNAKEMKALVWWVHERREKEVLWAFGEEQVQEASTKDNK
jgi:hypothetical protein